MLMPPLSLRLTLLGLALVACIGCQSPSSSTSGSDESGESAAPASNPQTVDPSRTVGSVDRVEPALDDLVPPNAQIEVLAEGFDWGEGPVWVPEDGGYVLFTDVPQNTIYKWSAGEGLTPWLRPSGYTGADPSAGEGANGLLLDRAGRLVLCQHGDRRMARLDAPLSDPQPQFTTLAATYDGQRFNSPNDAVFHRSGALYFTDPPYGLPEGADDPAREIDVSGVYRLDPDGAVSLVVDSLSRPNGIGLAPDEETLYVANSDPDRALWAAYDVQPDGSLANGRVFFDATEWTGDRPGLPDGLKVDPNGNVFATGPGGVLVFAPDGTHLGTINTTLPTANLAFGGSDGRTLFMTADSTLQRVPTRTTSLRYQRHTAE